MAIAPKKEQLNSAFATPFVTNKGFESPVSKSASSSAADADSVGTDSADQLLAEVKAKIKAQLAPVEKPSASSSLASSSSVLSSSLPLSQSVEWSDDQLAERAARPIATSQAQAASGLFPPDDSFVPEQSTGPAPQPQLAMQSGAPTFETLDVQQMAAEGYFQAIAYWLNEVLIPQNVYAKVLPDEVAGRIKVLIEYERAPQQKRLIRFVCDRLYRLNSPVIEGVHILVRPVGALSISWRKSVRIPTATEREQPEAQNSQQQQRQQKISPAVVPVSTLLPPAQVETAKSIVRRRFQCFRAALVCGSAFAAFALGGFFNLLLSEQLIGPAASRPSDVSVPILEDGLVPWYGETNEPDIFQPSPRNRTVPQATAISFRPASRFLGRTVEAAFETVAVIPHSDVENPSDPTVTLMFGGELALNDFTFKGTTDLDTLFSDIDIYRQADVAMMGLAEPLAYASTSLQEDFHQRTRPQAVEALKSGGIDIVGLASDGTMAHGSRGLSETLNNLDRQGIYRVGAGRNQPEAHRPEILEVKGQRIAYLGYNSDALKGASKEKAGVALAHTQMRSHVQADIKAIRNQVDWVVVNYRWDERRDADGSEIPEAIPEAESNANAQSNQPMSQSVSAKAPTDWQQVLAHEAVDAGADLVVGSHPAQIQGVEIYRDRPIAYSLGDFAFSRNPQTNSLSARDTAALKVSLRNQRMKVEFFPVTLNEDSKLQKASGDRGANLLQSIRSASKTFDRPLQFPAVLKPDVSVTKPIPASTAPERWQPDSRVAEPDAVAIPEPLTPDLTPEPLTEEDAAPALNPMMQESEALFMPAEERPAAVVDDEEKPKQTSEQLLDSEQLVDRELDAQWQDETWQKELKETQEAWEMPASSADIFNDGFDSESDVVLETLPDESEMYPWQDPFEQQDLDDTVLENAESAIPNSAIPSSESSSAEDGSAENGSAENGSIRPYAEPMIGPLSSTLTPPTASNQGI